MDLLEDAVGNDSFFKDATVSATETLATYLSQLLARIALFAIGFVVILLVWFLISRALDLAFKLPILNVINTAGGAVFGLVKAAIVIIILVWIAQMFDWIAADPPSPVLSLFTLQGIKNILNRLVV